MNPFEMVVAIIVVVTIGRVLQARYGIRKDWRGNEYQVDRNDGASAAENARLREEVRTLKDRVQVLERVITDNDSSLRLDREIEKLRDKNEA
ncbi:hypothetical protein [Stakelama tenebrarum]|uniref:Uncharacterized protein n=1 Tax=Stakelama tenebrarum TaxID=2711215 RepID=A0A6G6Y5M6_9SPHN|nr:hypothetical protein [Sphingosinithalassobacter tenebrarum]QIG80254.1 hypothetical protein G5C33_11025 [Sphingosinithalassobacter tenebrarum]